MSRTILAVAATATVGLVLVATAAKSTGRDQPVPDAEDRVKRGKYLVTFGSCNDCHTPFKFDQRLKMPVPDMSRMLSGHPAGAPDPGGSLAAQDIGLIGPTFTSFKLPFGTVYSRNLTPHKSGLADWTEEEFVRALKTGKHRGGAGRPILPPMPWKFVGSLSEDDLKSIWAYLRTIPPIDNEVPDPKVPLEVIEGIAKSYDLMHADAAQAAKQGSPSAIEAVAPGDALRAE